MARDRMEYRSVDGIWSVRRTHGREKPRPTRVVKYELGSVPGRTSLGYSDLGVDVPSARREGGMSNRPRARAPGERAYPKICCSCTARSS